MSHFTARDIKQLDQLLEAALLFLQFTGNRDQALWMLLQGARALLPFFASLVEINDLEACSYRYWREGLLTDSEYSRIKQLVGK